MIGLPFNDLRCLGSITELVAELVTNRDPVIVELATPTVTCKANDHTVGNVPTVGPAALPPVGALTQASRAAACCAPAETGVASSGCCA